MKLTTGSEGLMRLIDARYQSSVRRSFYAAVTGLLVVAIATPANALPADRLRVEARPDVAAATGCPTMQIFGVRGSGETSDDAGGYGDTVRSVVDAVQEQAPGAAATAVDYPAIKIDIFNPLYSSRYARSVKTGVANLTTLVNSFVGQASCEATRIYLIGYSQGAQVVGDYVESQAGRQVLSRIGGIVMFGDPKFEGTQSNLDVGSYNKHLTGIQLVVSLRGRNFNTKQTRLARSYCLQRDPICNFSPDSAAACAINLSTCPHFQYPFAQLRPGITYTKAAANFLVAQWKKFGPTAPTVGSRSNILIFGNADGADAATNLDTALTSAGYTVTTSSDLPTDLAPYGQVWWVGINDLTSAGDQELTNYAKDGGSLYLTGEWQGCGCNDTDVKTIFDSLVLTVGGLEFGPDTASGSDIATRNTDASFGLTTQPNILTTYTTSAYGTISPNNITPDHFVFEDNAGNGVVAAWGPSEVNGGGRLIIDMDINWLESAYDDPATMPKNASNLAFFLSGATTGRV